jgi:hypothetical protein
MLLVVIIAQRAWSSFAVSRFQNSHVWSLSNPAKAALAHISSLYSYTETDLSSILGISRHESRLALPIKATISGESQGEFRTLYQTNQADVVPQ